MSPSTPVKLRLPFQPNPFGSAAFGTPWANVSGDVPAINDAAFRKLMGALLQMRAGSPGTSIVVVGPPGSGKTHLLGRLRRQLEADELQGKGETVYIYIRCNASAATLWRHLRHALSGDLVNRQPHGISRLHLFLQKHPERLQELQSLSLKRVLECLRDGRQVLAASAWLRGEPVLPADLAALGVAIDADEEDRSREAEAKQFVDALLHFLSPTPVVLCFDQVEALQTYIGEEHGFHTMGQVISALNDAHFNLLLISCIVSAFEDLFDRIPNGADRDRWLQGGKASLRPIDWNQAGQLIQARLADAPALTKARLAHGDRPLWPIDSEPLQPLFAATGLCLPRTILQACKQQFDLLLDDGAPLAPAKNRESFLRDEFETNLHKARIVFQQQGGDKIAADCLPWLLETSGAKPLGQDAQRARFANQAYRTSTGSNPGDTAIALCFGRSNELTHKLAKIDAHWNPASLRLTILRDASVTPGKKGAELLAALKSKGAQEIHPLPEALAALQAIRNMVASARSGELFHGQDLLSEQDITGWALAHLPSQLEDLRSQLAGKERAGTDLVLPKLLPLISERKIIEADAAARELSLTLEEVSGCARRHPMRFGVLGGPPLLIFEATFKTPSPEPLHVSGE